MTDQPPAHCGCETCIATYDAAFNFIHGLLYDAEHPICISHATHGILRALADANAITTRPGHEEAVKARVIGLFERRYDEAIRVNAEVEAQIAGRAN